MFILFYLVIKFKPDAIKLDISSYVTLEQIGSNSTFLKRIRDRRGTCFIKLEEDKRMKKDIYFVFINLMYILAYDFFRKRL